MTSESKGTLPLFRYFATYYARQSIFVIMAFMAAALAESIGIGALLPLVTTVIGGSDKIGFAQETVTGLFASIGIVPSLLNMLVVLVVTIAMKSTIVFFALRYTGYVAADIARNFQLRLIDALMKAQWQYFSGLSTGVVSNAIAAEAQRAGHSYMLAGRAISSFMQAIIYIAAAFIVSWQLSVFAFVLGGIMVFLMKGVMNAARKTGQELSVRMNTLLTQVSESLGGAKPLKAMALEDMFYAQLKKETGEVAAARKKQYGASLLLQIISEPFIVLFLALGLYFVLTKTTVPIPEVIMLAFLFQRLMGYVTQTQSHYQNMLQNEGAVWSMQKQIEQALHMQEPKGAHVVPTFERDISFLKVQVSYKDGRDVLKDFNCQIKANSLTVIFGPSGAGKTTLIDTMLGLMPIQSGRIEIDGQSLDAVDLRAWRKMTGYVPQDNFLFHDTVRWNITLGNNSYRDEHVYAALREAVADDFVNALPQGIDTIVGERGGKLSGGQRQRIILARALIRKPDLLILDEPTSALDRENERSVFSVLKSLSRSMAIVIISHQEQVLSIADQTILLDAGKKA